MADSTPVRRTRAILPLAAVALSLGLARALHLTAPATMAALSRAAAVMAFLLSVTLLAAACGRLGLFRAAASVLGRGGRVGVVGHYAGVMLLAVVVTSVLSLDATAVLVTPVAISMARRAGRSPVLTALLCLWLANVGSLAFPLANLTNLLAGARLSLGTGAFVGHTWIVSLVLIVTCAVWGAVVSRLAPVRGRPSASSGEGGEDVSADATVAALCLVIGVAVAVVVGVPPWVATLTAALVACGLVRALQRGSARAMVRGLPWATACYATALITAMAAIGPRVVPTLAEWLPAPGGGTHAWALAGLGLVAANGINNLPAYVALELVARGSSDLWALLVAVNCGPMLTPWGSLANLLWLDACRCAGLRLRAWRVVAVSAPLALIASALGVAILA